MSHVLQYSVTVSYLLAGCSFPLLLMTISRATVSRKPNKCDNNSIYRLERDSQSYDLEMTLWDLSMSSSTVESVNSYTIYNNIFPFVDFHCNLSKCLIVQILCNIVTSHIRTLVT